MVVIDQQPTAQLNPAYLPLVYLCTINELDTRVSPVIECVVYVNGTEADRIKLTSVEYEAGTTAGTTDYHFEFDAQEVIQDWFESAQSPLPTVPGAAYLEAGFIPELSVGFYGWQDNGSGLLIRSGDEELSNEVFVMNAYRFSQQAPNLLEYIGSSGRKFFTYIPNKLSLCRSASFYLAAYNNDEDFGLSVSTYIGATLQSTGVIYPGAARNNAEVVIAGVGPENLTAPGVDWQDDAAVFTNATTHYTIQAVEIVGSLLIPLTAVFTITLKDGCCGRQLLFLNPFGVFDSLFVDDETVITYDISGEQYTSPRALPTEAVYLLSRASGFMEKRAANKLVFNLPESRDAWRDYYRSFLNSPEVYLVIDGDMVPVNVETGAFNILRNFNLAVTVTWANEDVSQRT